MKTTLLLITALLSFSFAQAQQPNTEVDTQFRGETGSSGYNRAGKQYQLTAILTGVGPSYSSTTGLSLGYFLDRDKMLLIEGTGKSTTRRETTWFSTSRSTYDINSESLGIHFKHFVGNSFYYRAGVDYRKLGYDYQNNFSNTTEQISFSGDSVALNFQIGNQWQWDNFTLGCDWVGLSMPISSNVKDKSLNTAAQADAVYYNNKIEDDSTLYIKNTNLNLLRFYLGASF